MDARVAHRYAEALFSLAEETGSTAAWQKQLETVKEVFTSNPGIGKVFSSVKVPGGKKKEILEEAFAGCDRYLVHFLDLLVDEGRTAYLTRIIREYDKMADEAQGVARGTAYSAYPLREAELRELEEAVGKRIHKTVYLKQKEDPDLLLGVRVEVGGTVWDGSARGRMERMRESLLEGR